MKKCGSWRESRGKNGDVVKKWCERGESNPHGCPLGSKPSASASSATLAKLFVMTPAKTVIIAEKFIIFKSKNVILAKAGIQNTFKI